MSKYQNFIGIDIGKFTFVASLHGNKPTQEYNNDSSGIKNFINDFKKHLPYSLVVLETTGGCGKANHQTCFVFGSHGGSAFSFFLESLL